MPPPRSAYLPPRKPRWGALALVVALHGLAISGLIRAFAPDLAAGAIARAATVFAVTVTTQEPIPQAEPDAGASGKEGQRATPRERAAPRPPLALQPADLPETASTGAASQSGARDDGAGSGAGAQGAGSGGGASGTGQGGGMAARPSVRSGELNQARDFPIPKGGRQTRFGRSVTVQFTVTTEGRARDCSVVRSEVDEATTARVCPLVIEKIRFNPARRADGTPVEARYGYRVDFRQANEGKEENRVPLAGSAR